MNSRMWNATTYIFKFFLQPGLPMWFRFSQFHVLLESSLSMASALLGDKHTREVGMWGFCVSHSRDLASCQPLCGCWETGHVAQISLVRAVADILWFWICHCCFISDFIELLFCPWSLTFGSIKRKGNLFNRFSFGIKRISYLTLSI